MTLPSDHTYDLDLEVSRPKFETGRNEKYVSYPFMTMALTCVTMVRWVDVPDSARGDFRCDLAVNIFSLLVSLTVRGSDFGLHHVWPQF